MRGIRKEVTTAGIFLRLAAEWLEEQKKRVAQESRSSSHQEQGTQYKLESCKQFLKNLYLQVAPLNLSTVLCIRHYWKLPGCQLIGTACSARYLTRQIVSCPLISWHWHSRHFAGMLYWPSLDVTFIVCLGLCLGRIICHQMHYETTGTRTTSLGYAASAPWWGPSMRSHTTGRWPSICLSWVDTRANSLRSAQGICAGL